MSSERTSLLTALRSNNITQVIANYSGSGDEGFIDEINFKPAEPDQPLRRLVDDFFWEDVIGGSNYDGFHNNDGGYGTITWDITADKLVLHHHDYYTDEVDHGEEEIN